MIPTEIAELMTLIYPHWADLDDDFPTDRDSFREVLAAARRIHEAGYRKPVAVGTADR